ncbi:MAG: hypothetical protein HKP41_13785 [Desulfobacterales bacterium]|nr:hypothetical protein [Deltaproteobacteria bacterium]NNK95416.1 hypothetical protein [Desulfobacterales bacterium]
MQRRRDSKHKRLQPTVAIIAYTAASADEITGLTQQNRRLDWKLVLLSAKYRERR